MVQNAPKLNSTSPLPLGEETNSKKSSPKRTEMQDLHIIWIGFHMEGQAALETLLQEGIQVGAVVTLAEAQLAKRSGASRYESICNRYGLPLHKIRHIDDPDSIELLRKLAPDVVFVIGWSQIVGREALRIPRLGTIGSHAAVLPHNRGSAPVNWAIIRGETEAGNTLMWLAEGVDEGEIIDQVSFPITPYDTCATIYDKVALSGSDMILRLIPKLIAGERPGRQQLRTDEAVLPRRRPKDGLVDWNRSSLDVYNFIRALTHPYPGAFSFLDGAQHLIWDAVFLPGDPYRHAKPGEVVGAAYHPHPSHSCGQVVACGEGAVLLMELESIDGTILKGQELAEQTLKGKIWSNG